MHTASSGFLVFCFFDAKGSFDAKAYKGYGPSMFPEKLPQKHPDPGEPLVPLGYDIENLRPPMSITIPGSVKSDLVYDDKKDLVADIERIVESNLEGSIWGPGEGVPKTETDLECPNPYVSCLDCKLNDKDCWEE